MTTLTEINVTPLLDLAFVLLIIFIITTPLLENTAELIIPTSRATGEAAAKARTAVLTVNAMLQLTLDGQPVAKTALPGILAEQSAADPTFGVVIRAHRALPVQELVEIMDMLKLARITRVGVVTQEPGGAESQ